MTHLGLPAVLSEQANWIYWYFIINCYANHPNDYEVLDFNKISANEHFECFLHKGSYLQDISDIKESIRLICPTI